MQAAPPSASEPAASDPAAGAGAGIRSSGSIRARLLLGAALVLLAFLAGAGLAVQRAHEGSVRAAHFARLQSTVYLVLARAELDEAGQLSVSGELPEPRLSLPGSGLYAAIWQGAAGQPQWRSPSALGLALPFAQEQAVGQWRYEALDGPQGRYFAAVYAVRWAGAAAGQAGVPLVLTVLEDRAGFDREIGAFNRTLWAWLGGAALLLLLAQLLLLGWGLAPLRRLAAQVGRIESGGQERVEGPHPSELAPLAGNLNTLLQHERARQTRHREALSYLAHSLKTPLAVLRNALEAPPAALAATVREQVARMDGIVQHQLGRAAAGGAALFAPALLVAPVLGRIRAALDKVYAGKGLRMEIDCPAQLAWRIGEGDLFEMMGNVLDNAAKWAAARVQVRAWRDAGALHLQVDDDGPGFSDTESVRRIHVRGDERVPGHGVGLAVVSDIVASLHGELRLERGALGGARVHIVLPAP